MSRLRQCLQRYRLRIGRFLPPSGRNVLLCIEGEATESARAFAARFMAQFPREHLFFIERSAPAAPLANCSRIPYPFPLWGGARYLRRLGTAYIVVDRGVSPAWQLLVFARRADIILERMDHWPPDGSGIDRAMAALAEEMGRARGKPATLKHRVKFYLWRNVTLRLFPRGVQRLPSILEVGKALGHPQRVLCLGNGPSSSDLTEPEDAYDAVLRVNDRWLDLGLFTRPDVVFTGDAKTVERVGDGPLYGFMDDISALRIVRKIRGKVKPLRHFTAAELGFPLEKFGHYHPTNGLLMLYLAVALQPKTLTVAGIDLYQDSRGCYPDDRTTPNNYASMHHPAKEVACLLELLAAYRGRLRIVGEGALGREFKRYIDEKSKSA